MENLNDLIAAAQAILDTGFDLQAFMTWDLLAFLTIAALLGPFHYYTQNFRRLTSDKTPRGLLAGRGLVEAAKAELLIRGEATKSNNSAVGNSVPNMSNMCKYRERLAQLVTLQDTTSP